MSHSLACYCKALQTWINWHLCLALPALELRSWPCLPSTLQDNLLTFNGLSHFFLSPCEKQRVFLSLPLPPPMLWNAKASGCLGARTNYKHLAAGGVFSPPLSFLSSAAAGQSLLRLWMAPSPRGCPWIRNSLWLLVLDLEAPYSAADLITSWRNDVGPWHRGMMSWALTCHQKKYKLPGAGTVSQGDFCSLHADLRVGRAFIPFIPPHWDHHDHSFCWDPLCNVGVGSITALWGGRAGCALNGGAAIGLWICAQSPAQPAALCSSQTPN